MAGFGGDNGLAINAQLAGPTRVAVDSAGNLYIADAGNNRVRKVSNGVITTVAGNGIAGFNGDFLPATSAQLNSPWGIAVDLAGNLYIGDGANAAGNCRIRKVSNGVITTVAGNGTAGYSGDNGPATAAQLTDPAGLVVDSTGSLNIADAFSRRVRRISDGIITTIAGNGTSGLYTYVGPATSGSLDDPFGVAFDLSGTLYIADISTIRRVSNGVMVTVAGNGKQGFSGDNGPAINAQFFDAFDVAASRDGNLYVADRGNNRIRVLTPIGPSCVYTVTPATLQALASGTTLTVTIQTTASCSWTVSGLPSWIAVSGTSSGIGSAAVPLVVFSNSGAARSTTISVGGVSVTINQLAASTTPPPSITALVNAASFRSGPIAPGEVVTIGGAGLGPSTPRGLALDPNGTVSTSLGGVQVLFSGIPAPLTYVSATQINAVVPYEVRGLLQAGVQVAYLGQTSNTFLLSAPVATAPAVFTFNGTGTGPGAILNQDNSYNAPNNPALRGSYVSLYLTGEGLTQPSSTTGKVTTVSATAPLTPQPILPVAVFIASLPAPVAFYGEAPGLVAGVLQVNVQIPVLAPAGDLPVTVSIGGGSTQSGVTVSVR
jgi:uncharacterized protein (TIGR03437 family)